MDCELTVLGPATRTQYHDDGEGVTGYSPGSRSVFRVPARAAMERASARSMRPAMLGGVAGTRVAERLAALRELWANPGLRRAELAWGGFHTAEWASLVALAVVAFAADGAAAVGVVLFARMVPSALVAPLVAVAGDRAPRERILLAAHLVRAVASRGRAGLAPRHAGARGLHLRGARRGAARGAPAVPPCTRAASCSNAAKLAASNVAALTFESAAVLCGPVLAAILLAVSGPSAASAPAPCCRQARSS